MRIMVFGGAGFLGSALVDSLAKTRSNTIQVLDTFSHGFPKKPHKSKNVLPPISGSIRNYYDVLRPMERFKPEIVIHLAAFNSRPETIGDFRTCSEINYVGTANVLQACLALRNIVQRVIFASTLAAEEPVSHYGVSKRAAEDLLESVFLRFPEGSRQLITLRFAEIYGNGRPYTSTSLLNFLANGMVQNQTLGVFGVKEKIDCIHLSDAVRACELATKVKIEKNTVRLDIGTGEGIVVQDLVNKLKEASGYTGQIKFYPTNNAIPFQTLVADPKPAKEILGFEAEADLTEEIAALIKARRKALK